jgi:hypothetical protein
VVPYVKRRAQRTLTNKEVFPDRQIAPGTVTVTHPTPTTHIAVGANMLMVDLIGWTRAVQYVEYHSDGILLYPATISPFWMVAW